jgi:RNA polymerase sigma factor (sigma-70 family)
MGGGKMKKYNKLIIFFLVIIALTSIPHTKFNYLNFRRIRNFTEIKRGAPLYQFVSYLYQKFGERGFTKKDVQDLTDWSYQSIHDRIKFLTDIGILNVEEGRPNYYRFSEQFQDPENIELLIGIREFHKASFEGSRQEGISLIKEEIGKLLEAKNNLDISISKGLEDKASELRKKLLIAMSYYGLLDFFNSFSYVRFEKGIDEIRYNKVDNNITISISGPNYFISQKVPTIFDWEDIVWRLRPELTMSVFSYEIDLEGRLNKFLKDIGLEEKIFPSEALLRINKLSIHIVRRRVGEENGIFYSSELYEDYTYLVDPFKAPIPYSSDNYDMSFLETFVANRNKKDIQPLYAKYLNLQGKLVENIIQGLYKLDSRKSEILILRYLKGMSLKDVAEKFNLTRERIRRLEKDAIYKLGVLLKDSLKSLQDGIEDTLQDVFNILYGG